MLLIGSSCSTCEASCRGVHTQIRHTCSARYVGTVYHMTLCAHTQHLNTRLFFLSYLVEHTFVLNGGSTTN